MYVYDCNANMKTVTKKIGNKGMIYDFTEFTTEFKIRGINPGFHIMDREASTVVELDITTMDINYQLVPPSNHRDNNSERAMQTFRKNFIYGICSVDEIFHIKLWDRLLHKETINLNLLRK